LPARAVLLGFAVGVAVYYPTPMFSRKSAQSTDNKRDDFSK